MKPIYLDYNATTPIDPAVAKAMRPCLDEIFGNPSSTHWYGLRAKEVVEAARTQVAALLNGHAEEIIFTSGGTESNNHAIKGAAFANRDRGNHIITSAIEHPAVSEVCRYLEGHGFRVTYVPVDIRGLVDLKALEEAITGETILITVMHANNEVGTIQPIEEIAALIRGRGITLHTDAAQSAGKVPVDVKALGVDLLSLAGHKLYAPKGIGALYIREGTRLEKFMHGAGHEKNLRAGTENVLEIAGLGKACELAKEDLEENMARMGQTRDRLYEGLRKGLDIRLNGHPEKRLPNTLSIGFRGVDAGILLGEMKDLAASVGAACHGASVEISKVLKAMAVPMEYARGTVRFSTGKSTTIEEIDRAVEIVDSTMRRLKK
ncbi:MAG: cysteine desulfurase family protein [Deltaproteobacteria bacterium]|nr:cysteine desulfurase family protein [Deltaproteobacteria bacterium]